MFRSGEGLLCLEALLAVILFTAVLVLGGLGGAAGVEAALRLEADSLQSASCVLTVVDQIGR